MFKNPFSFNGRIRRTEFAISFVLYLVAYLLIYLLAVSARISIVGLAYVPAVWFLWAQGAKRCHDLNKSGWWQIIPFYVFWMLFQSSVDLYNEYGGESIIYGADDYEKPYDADSLNVNPVIPATDNTVQ